jgi:hypothetical protein
MTERQDSLIFMLYLMFFFCLSSCYTYDFILLILFMLYLVIHASSGNINGYTTDIQQIYNRNTTEINRYKSWKSYICPLSFHEFLTVEPYERWIIWLLSLSHGLQLKTWHDWYDYHSNSLPINGCYACLE